MVTVSAARRSAPVHCRMHCSGSSFALLPEVFVILLPPRSARRPGSQQPLTQSERCFFAATLCPTRCGPGRPALRGDRPAKRRLCNGRFLLIGHLRWTGELSGLSPVCEGEHGHCFGRAPFGTRALQNALFRQQLCVAAGGICNPSATTERETSRLAAAPNSKRALLFCSNRVPDALRAGTSRAPW